MASEGHETILIKEPDDEIETPSSQILQNELDAREGEQWASIGVIMTAGINEIVRDIESGTAVGVSDGYFKDGFGTVSWILENTSGSQRIMGNVLIPGFQSNQSVYRSEIGGIYGLVMVVKLIKSIREL